MWNRQNLKENAKVAFKRNYWKCVLVALILAIATSTGSAGSSAGQSAETIFSGEVSEIYMAPEDIMQEILPPGGISHSGSIAFTSILVVIVLIILVIGICVQFFLFGPLEIGCKNFFKANAYEQADLNKITFGFQKDNYINNATTMFLRNLYIALWSLLFIIPGVIKAYEYRMIPYILTDCPDMPRQEAFRISKEMMRGNKMEAFLLDLSFLGWSLLAAITCGIVGIFYVSPYVAATDAELFIAIREEYFRGQREVQNENNTDYSGEN